MHTPIVAHSLTVPRYVDLMLLLVAVAWGSSYAIAKEALALYPVLGFIALRFGLAALLLAPRLMRRGAWPGLGALPLGALLLAIFLCETYGVVQTSAANAAFLISLCVVFTPLVEWALLGVRPRAQVLGACGLALGGAALLAGELELRVGLGDGLILLAALLRALMVCMTRRQRLSRESDALALTAVQSLVVAGGAVALALSLPGEGLPALPRAWPFWLALGYLVMCCTLFALFVQNHALRHASPTRVSLLMGSEPLFGALFAAFWLDERLSVGAWAGGCAIVFASLWAIRASAPGGMSEPDAPAARPAEAVGATLAEPEITIIEARKG